MARYTSEIDEDAVTERLAKLEEREKESRKARDTWGCIIGAVLFTSGVFFFGFEFGTSLATSTLTGLVPLLLIVLSICGGGGLLMVSYLDYSDIR